MTATLPPAAQRWIEPDPASFRDAFNVRSFALQHGLARQPHFQLPKLVELAERTLRERPKHVHCDLGYVDVAHRWDGSPDRSFSAVEALERIENAGAWLVLYHAELDPEYREIFDLGLTDLKLAIGRDLDREIMEEEIIIFVTSPKRVTPYHIDRNCNFLLQIRGTKTVHVFERDDRDVISEEELERNWTVNDKQPAYRAHLQDRATSYHFEPGTGCHIPVNAPHWVENHDNVSISLSVNFQFKDHLLGNIYRANYLLRRLGLRPTPPGRSRLLDSVKGYGSPPATWAATSVMQMRSRRTR